MNKLQCASVKLFITVIFALFATSVFSVPRAPIRPYFIWNALCKDANYVNAIWDTGMLYVPPLSTEPLEEFRITTPIAGQYSEEYQNYAVLLNQFMRCYFANSGFTDISNPSVQISTQEFLDAFSISGQMLDPREILPYTRSQVVDIDTDSFIGCHCKSSGRPYTKVIPSSVLEMSYGPQNVCRCPVLNSVIDSSYYGQGYDLISDVFTTTVPFHQEHLEYYMLNRGPILVKILTCYAMHTITDAQALNVNNCGPNPVDPSPPWFAPQEVWALLMGRTSTLLPGNPIWTVCTGPFPGFSARCWNVQLSPNTLSINQPLRPTGKAFFMYTSDFYNYEDDWLGSCPFIVPVSGQTAFSAIEKAAWATLQESTTPTQKIRGHVNFGTRDIGNIPARKELSWNIWRRVQEAFASFKHEVYAGWDKGQKVPDNLTNTLASIAAAAAWLYSDPNTGRANQYITRKGYDETSLAEIFKKNSYADIIEGDDAEEVRHLACTLLEGSYYANHFYPSNGKRRERSKTSTKDRKEKDAIRFPGCADTLKPKQIIQDSCQHLIGKDNIVMTQCITDNPNKEYKECMETVNERRRHHRPKIDLNDPKYNIPVDYTKTDTIPGNKPPNHDDL